MGLFTGLDFFQFFFVKQTSRYRRQTLRQLKLNNILRLPSSRMVALFFLFSCVWDGRPLCGFPFLEMYGVEIRQGGLCA